MLIVVPDDLPAFEWRLDDRLLAAIRAATRAGGTARARVPRFAVTTHAWLDPPLTAMGMRTTFSSGDFGRMVEAGPFILGPVEHEAVVGVTDAAHASGRAEAVAPGERRFDVDRPFLFFVGDRSTGATLLTGRVVRPSS